MHKKNRILKWTVRILSLGVAGFATYVAVCGVVDKPTLLVCLCVLGSIALTLIIFALLLRLSCFFCRHTHHNGHHHGHRYNRDGFRRDKRDFKFLDKSNNMTKKETEYHSSSNNGVGDNDNSLVDKYW